MEDIRLDQCSCSIFGPVSTGMGSHLMAGELYDYPSMSTAVSISES